MMVSARIELRQSGLAPFVSARPSVFEVSRPTTPAALAFAFAAACSALGLSVDEVVRQLDRPPTPPVAPTPTDSRRPRGSGVTEVGVLPPVRRADRQARKDSE